MRQFHHRLPDAVTRKANAQGAAGAAWLAQLSPLVAELTQEWRLTLGSVLPGGSEALVAEARTADGRDAVLKIGIPGSDSGAAEASVLIAAAGRGYAELIAHDEARRAMLMERLGPTLDVVDPPTAVQIEILCGALSEAWMQPPTGLRFVNGAEKAASLAAFIEETTQSLDQPCSTRAVDTALAFAERRGQAFDPVGSVLAHGDAHPGNALRVSPADPWGFKFVDPDGLFIEPAYDLGILMRGWGAELLAGDPLRLGLARAEMLGRLTGIDVQPIWEWGFIERVSTGLLLRSLGLDTEAAEFLNVANAWARGV